MPAYALERTDYSWLQVDKYGSRNVLASARFAEKCVERVIAAPNGLVTRHLTIGLNSMLQAVQFPTRITNLDTGLSNVD